MRGRQREIFVLAEFGVVAALSLLVFWTYFSASSIGAQYTQGYYGAALVAVGVPLNGKWTPLPEGISLSLGQTVIIDQPEGAIFPIALFLASFNYAGIRLMEGFFALLAFVFMHLVLRKRIGAGFLPSAALATVFIANRFSWELLSSNLAALIGAPLLIASLFLLLGDAVGDAGTIGAGLLFGLAVGVRHEWILLGPAFLYLAWSRRKRGITLFSASAAAFGLLWMRWHYVLFGNPLVHEVVVAKAATFRHCFFGAWCFDFNGMLNFQGGIVRSFGFAYPVFIYLPLYLMLGFGSVAMGLAVAGFLTRRRRILLVLLAGAIPLSVLILPQENWDTFKSGVYFPMAIFLAIAAAEAIREKRLLAAGLAISVVLLMAGRAAYFLPSFPLDPRTFERFPPRNLTSEISQESEEARAWKELAYSGTGFLPSLGAFSVIRRGGQDVLLVRSAPATTDAGSFRQELESPWPPGDEFGMMAQTPPNAAFYSTGGPLQVFEAMRYNRTFVAGTGGSFDCGIISVEGPTYLIGSESQWAAAEESCAKSLAERGYGLRMFGRTAGGGYRIEEIVALNGTAANQSGP